jgi:hypothetical protein
MQTENTMHLRTTPIKGRSALWISLMGLFFAAGCLAATADKPKPVLRGTTWESIQKLPDFGTGMWTPGPPPGVQPNRPRGNPAGLFGADVPFKQKYKDMNEARMVRVRGQAEGGLDDIPLSNSGHCIPSGVPGNMMLVSHEYIFRPGEVVMILENSEIRRIFVDGRGHPSDDESNPNFQGHSIGHWEGDTLVVETKQIYPEAELFFGMTVTENTVIHERIGLVDKNTLKIDTRVEDDELFTKPWTYTRYYRRENRESVPYERCTLADRVQKVGDKLAGIDFDVNKNQPAKKPEDKAGDKK